MAIGRGEGGMYRIVFFNIPAHGHTNPTLGVVRELIRRGHTVLYYSYENMREKIEQTGATFVPCDAYDGEMRLPPRQAVKIGKNLALSTRVLADTTLALDAAILGDIRHMQPDCIVSDSMAIWGKAVAKKCGVPYVCSTTTFAFNRDAAKIMKPGAVEMIKMLLSLPAVGRQVRRLRAHGYPVRSVLDLIGHDDSARTIVYTSPQFQPDAQTFSHRCAFVGPSIRPGTGAFSKTRDVLVYVSMGTVNSDRLPLYKNCVRAFTDTGFQVILSVGSEENARALGALPDNVTVAAHVDQIAVLTQADVFVSHCGMNSASESLYFGVPLVMLPDTQEQHGVAARVQTLGAGVMLEKTDADSILRAVQQVLGDPAYRKCAKEIGEGFRRCPGASGAADVIEQACRCPEKQIQ